MQHGLTLFGSIMQCMTLLTSVQQLQCMLPAQRASILAVHKHQRQHHATY